MVVEARSKELVFDSSGRCTLESLWLVLVLVPVSPQSPSVATVFDFYLSCSHALMLLKYSYSTK